MLQINNAKLTRGDRPIFDGLSCTVHAGHKVGIVGRNGAGKSTLFQLILGRIALEAGELVLPGDWRIGHLAQELEPSERSAIDYVMDGHSELRSVEAAITAAEAAGDGNALARLHGQYDDLGGYGVRAEAQRILSGLGFSSAEFESPFNSFSGGWRIRLALGRALLQPTELLLLDEPTNHLDMESSLWLEQWLQRYEGTALIIAHDRAFLDATTRHTLHLQGGTATLYRGGYSAYERQRAEQLAQALAARTKQEAERAHIESFVRRFRAKASKAKQAQSRLKALERMEELAPIHADSPYHVRFAEPRAMPSPLLALHDLVLGYGRGPVLEGVQETILPADRIGVLGPNGAGKSTLLKALVGELEPEQGDIVRGRGLTCGYFAQHRADSLDGRLSALATCLRRTGRTEQWCRTYLGGWGFSGDMVERPASTLSGGEKSRLTVALMATEEPNLMILDEPTNHLDLDLREALALALQDYPGALIVVSHDRAFLTRTVDRFWRVDHGQVARHDGDLEDYRGSVSIPGTPDTAAPAGGGGRKGKRQQAAAGRAALAPLKKAFDRLDRALGEQTRELQQLEARLADPEVYHGLAADELDQLMAQAGRLRRALERTESQWLEAAAALEDSTAAATAMAGD
jgi:ATP-binding cassette subfamily F protein 3